jgi:hypothetical protein
MRSSAFGIKENYIVTVASMSKSWVFGQQRTATIVNSEDLINSDDSVVDSDDHLSDEEEDAHNISD